MEEEEFKVQEQEVRLKAVLRTNAKSYVNVMMPSTPQIKHLHQGPLQENLI